MLRTEATLLRTSADIRSNRELPHHYGTFLLKLVMSSRLAQHCIITLPHNLNAGFGVASVQELALRYIRAIRGVQPDGPYVLVGYSFGCRVATAMCLLLQTVQLDVRCLVLIDGPVTGPVDLGTHPDVFAKYLAVSRLAANPPSLLQFMATADSHVQGDVEGAPLEQFRPAYISLDQWRVEIGAALAQTRHCVNIAEHHTLDSQQVGAWPAHISLRYLCP